MTMPQWELIHENEPHEHECCRTMRMAVPGGWLYRHSTSGTVEQYHDMMAFVPAPPDPPLMFLSDARTAGAHEELVAALEAFLAWLDNDERYSPGPSLEDVVKLARAALAKARGERA